jgi:two-component system, NtrC family, C4-dicarboxylate transport response regulator DctD
MKTICVIDDDAIYQKMINQHLTIMGYSVHSLFTGRDLEKIPKRPFAILLDHFLGEGEFGLEVLANLKKKLPDVPVIYMTNEVTDALKQQAKKAGAFEFIEKSPGSLVLLRNALDRIGEKEDKKPWIKRIFKK